MQIVIDIPDDIYEPIVKMYKADKELQVRPNLYKAIVNGTLLPKGHGRLIDVNEITAFRELECAGHNVESLDEFTTIIEADREVEG